MRIWKRWPQTSLFLALFACTHQAPPVPDVPAPSKAVASTRKVAAEADQGNCKEIPRDPKSYIVRLLDEKGEELNNPDLLVDIERRYDFFHADPAVQDVEVNGKTCLKIEGGWETLYVFNEARHQAKVVRFADLKIGRVNDLQVDLIPEKQMTYEYRECDAVQGWDKVASPKLYDLFDVAGQAINPARFKVIFESASGKRELPLSRGSCVMLESSDAGKIIASDGRDAYVYVLEGKGGENDRYLRIASKKKDTFKEHAADFQGLLKAK